MIQGSVQMTRQDVETAKRLLADQSLVYLLTKMLMKREQEILSDMHAYLQDFTNGQRLNRADRCGGYLEALEDFWAGIKALSELEIEEQPQQQDQQQKQQEQQQ